MQSGIKMKLNKKGQESTKYVTKQEHAEARMKNI